MQVNHQTGDESPIEQAIRLAGGPTALARELRSRGHAKVTSHSTVYQWVQAGAVPADYCPDIEDLTGIPCEKLRPSTNWGLAARHHLARALGQQSTAAGAAR